MKSFYSAFSLSYTEFDNVPLLMQILAIIHNQIYPGGSTNTLSSNSCNSRPHKSNFTQPAQKTNNILLFSHHMTGWKLKRSFTRWCEVTHLIWHHSVQGKWKVETIMFSLLHIAPPFPSLLHYTCIYPAPFMSKLKSEVGLSINWMLVNITGHLERA